MMLTNKEDPQCVKDNIKQEMLANKDNPKFVINNIKEEMKSAAATFENVKEQLRTTGEVLNHIEQEVKKVDHVIPVSIGDKFFYHDDHYQSHWPHFDHIHQEMINDSKLLWSKVHPRSFKENHKERAEENSMPLRHLLGRPISGPRRWMAPKFLSKDDADKNIPQCYQHDHEMMDQQAVHIRDDKHAFQVSMDTHGYTWEDIKVYVTSKNVLMVEGKHEEKKEGVYQARHFIREFQLPGTCEAHCILSSVSKDGILLVTAPKRNPEDKPACNGMKAK